MAGVLPEYGGPRGGPGDTLVLMPSKVAFFGRGDAISELTPIPGCWFGGELPASGFWGTPLAKIDDLPALINVVARRVNRQRT